MGADMIATWSDIPAWWDGSETKLVSRFADVDLEPLRNDIETQVFGDPPDAPTDWDLQAFVLDCYRYCVSCREVCIFNVHGHKIWVVGGLSWGDTPPGLDELETVAIVEEHLSSPLPQIVLDLEDLLPTSVANRAAVAAYATAIFESDPEGADRLYRFLDEGLQQIRPTIEP